MMIEQRHVMAVRNLAVAENYLRNCLGFNGTSPCKGWLLLSLDGFNLLVGECPSALPAAETGDHAYFAQLIVDDVDRYYETFKRQNAILPSEPCDKPWGLRELLVMTPDGHKIMFASEIETGSESSGCV